MRASIVAAIVVGCASGGSESEVVDLGFKNSLSPPTVTSSTVSLDGESPRPSGPLYVSMGAVEPSSAEDSCSDAYEVRIRGGGHSYVETSSAMGEVSLLLQSVLPTALLDAQGSPVPLASDAEVSLLTPGVAGHDTANTSLVRMSTFHGGQISADVMAGETTLTMEGMTQCPTDGSTCTDGHTLVVRFPMELASTATCPSLRTNDAGLCSAPGVCP